VTPRLPVGLPGARRRRRARATACGFTLVEVLVALAVMAVIAGMAWQGIDAMVRSRDAAHASSQTTLRTGIALAQWERDLWAVLATGVVPVLRFDGANVRMTREAADGGVQVVVWSRREGAWWRWASSGVTRTADLQELWLRSQQLMGLEAGTVPLAWRALRTQILRRYLLGSHRRSYTTPLSRRERLSSISRMPVKFCASIVRRS
jgi:prepilin-type N-terminal cleavage/methylation domain-containing protein